MPLAADKPAPVKIIILFLPIKC